MTPAQEGLGLLPLLQKAGGGSLVTLDFDNTQAWPAYDWMGVAKSALESVTRYLARDLGQHRIRGNAGSAGPPPARVRSSPVARVAVFFGGRSGEHEVSCVSAVSTLAALAAAGHEVVAVGI